MQALWLGSVLVLVVAMQVYLLLRGLRHSTHQLVLFEVYLSLALLTLGLAPALWYLLETLVDAKQLFFQMKVSAPHYFAYALPSLGALGLGLSRFKRPSSTSDQELLQKVQAQLQAEPYLPWLLMLGGFCLQLLQPYFLANLRQVGHFGGMLLWIGTIHLLLAPIAARVKMSALGLVLLWLMYRSITSTFFGDLLFWPLLIALYAQMYYQFSLRFLLGSGLGVLLGLLLIFSFKYEYRQRLWNDPNQGRYLQHLSEALQYRWQHPEGWYNVGQTFLTRINQGKHLAMVYNWVPQHEPYARGETLLSALPVVVVPRVIWPNKPQTGSLSQWYRFTGHQLGRGTSANFGICGEAYANLGIWLALPFLLLWAWSLRAWYEYLRRLALSWYPCLWLWIPLIYCGLLDQENDFVTQLNHGFKGTLFTLAMCWSLHKLSGYLPRNNPKLPLPRP
ncbi:MAG TPA: hypothetical protein PLC89_27620 [Haliscomenobacter sp.]|uniref:hypothetical protein n=1 Tax=Haliscomenobacter sp. TaxID=2717303 RepID=UPI002BAA0C4E|nr:hypothetical protein [Haliscomenobacter sp.]HOY21113.1 hypothetical protein [Haliscomenobacter sp.]